MTKILVADDEPDILRLLQTNLHSAGYEVIAAKDGQEAYELFVKHSPDVVMLDVMMPGYDGFTCCDKIRELPNGAEVPVAFLTAHGTYREAVGHGPNDFLTKPISRTELLARVANLVRMKRLADALRENQNQERVLSEIQKKLGGPIRSILAQARSLSQDVGDPRLENIVKEADTLAQLVERIEQHASKGKS